MSNALGNDADGDFFRRFRADGKTYGRMHALQVRLSKAFFPHTLKNLFLFAAAADHAYIGCLCAQGLRQYRALTSAGSGQERERIALDVRDRFGPFPEEFQTFLAILDFKQFLCSLQVQRADISLDHVRLTWMEGQQVAAPERIVALASATPGARLLPPAGLFLPLPEGDFSAGLRALREKLESVRVAPAGEQA